MKSIKTNPSRRSKKKGLPPGSLVHIGTAFPGQEGIIRHRYSAEKWQHGPFLPIEESQDKPEAGLTTWLEINGLSDNRLLDPVFHRLKVNALILEDILNTDQNAKNDTGDKWVFFILKNIEWKPADLSWTSEQISLVLQPDLLVSFAEKQSDLFLPVYDRLATEGSKIRTHGADYTFYALLDVMVDNYLEISEKLEMQIEEIELGMEGRQEFDPTQDLHLIRKFQIYFRHQVLPVKDGILKLLRDPDFLVSTDDLPYYHDILDHLNQVISQLDQIRENLASIRELYLSQLNMKMNKVIKLLTVVSTIFIPVTFIAGIYGMNFKHMPELEWQYGYFGILAVMLLLGLGSWIYFRRKRWM